MRLKKNKIEHLISGIGETSQRVTSSVWAQIRSRVNDYTLNLRLVVVPKITGHLPNQNVELECHVPSDIKLADPSFNKPQKIDLLLGATHFFDILCVGQTRLTSANPLYQKTVFDWVAAGPVSMSSRAKAMTLGVTFLTTESETTLENILQKFWIIEDLHNNTMHTQEEHACVNHFNKTVKLLEVRTTEVL